MDKKTHQRLARLCSWCVAGNAVGAELELHEWCRHDDAPAGARVLLASLLARGGRLEQALGVLRHGGAGRQAPEAAQDRMLTAVLIDAELTDSARRVAMQMHHRAGHGAGEAEWLRAMDAPGSAELPAVADADAEVLARELAEQPGVIASLVAAQKAHHEARGERLLRGALARLARQTGEPAQMLTICQALADLAVLAGDADEARRWAHRGLAINPYAAGLALVLGSLADDEAAGPPARDVLAQAAEAHPQYSDLHAALIRRENAEGLGAAARHRLAAWLQRQPGDPLAQKVAQELAA